MDDYKRKNDPKEMSFKELLFLIKDKRKILAVTTGIFTLLAIIFALALPNIYSSSALLAPANQNDSLSSQLGGLSSIASFTGVGIPNQATSPSFEGVERIQSLSFFSDHFLPYINLYDLFAIEGWNSETNKILYDVDIYDPVKEEWTRKVSLPRKQVPSIQEAYEVYLDILQISQDVRSEYVEISISHRSPFLAKEWLDIIVLNINESMRSEDIVEATNAIDFLNKSSQETNLTEIKDAISELLENQMQTLMLASANEFYVFKIIDAPFSPELKSSPHRSLIVLIGLISGFLIGLIFALVYRNE